MRSRLICLGMAISITLCGCETTEQRVGRDPLLLSRQGVEGSPGQAAPSALLVSAEPLPPDLPAMSLVSSRQPAALLREQASALARQKLETNEERLPKAEEKSIASQPAPAAVAQPERLPLTAIPVKRQVVHGLYGAAANHAWLQGTVETLGPDGAILRYGSPWVAGPDAFRVLLNADDRLKELRVGDVIRVEGDERRKPKESHASSLSIQKPDQGFPGFLNAAKDKGIGWAKWRRSPSLELQQM